MVRVHKKHLKWIGLGVFCFIALLATLFILNSGDNDSDNVRAEKTKPIVKEVKNDNIDNTNKDNVSGYDPIGNMVGDGIRAYLIIIFVFISFIGMFIFIKRMVD